MLVSDAELEHGITHEELGNFTFGLQIKSTYKAMAANAVR